MEGGGFFTAGVFSQKAILHQFYQKKKLNSFFYEFGGFLKIFLLNRFIHLSGFYGKCLSKGPADGFGVRAGTRLF